MQPSGKQRILRDMEGETGLKGEKGQSESDERGTDDTKCGGERKDDTQTGSRYGR